jgi:glutamine synthetase
MHVHQSIWKAGKPVMAGNKYADLSQDCLYYIGGIIKHAKALNAFTNPSTNSYKRLVPGYEAPVLLAYSARNRSASCRIPYTTNPKAKRIEFRCPDPACNPYLTFAVLLAAGLRGIENNYVLGPQAEDNVWTLTLEERRAMGYRELPSSLGVALAEMERSDLVAEALGEHVFDYFLRNKRAEWEEYRSNVTPFELKKYLAL